MAIRDQQQNSTAVSLGDFSGVEQARAQSFLPGYDSIVGASVFLLGSSQGNVRLNVGLFDSLAAGAKPLREVEVKGRRSTWLEASWIDDPFQVKRGATYFLVFSESRGADQFAFAGDQGTASSDPYPLGVAYSQRGVGGPFLPLDTANQRFDLAFRTYAIPEPATSALVGAGLLAVLLVARRRLAAT